ncbi:toxin-antitoxin system, antitoxin component, Xre domain protein [Bacteroides pyogenes F0041]|uniref:Toxin-antitoxin system, antitoxin component, Xre domain protein n=1 Tax=Bacteroides pyogenes F0041 TaxID=1321819 RepID=U2CWJ6_9BACE|nr:toxin-antitoxin system, antitoxin component, Xre domain protein [Bacteroides pyogenes F0041]
MNKSGISETESFFYFKTYSSVILSYKFEFSKKKLIFVYLS